MKPAHVMLRVAVLIVVIAVTGCSADPKRDALSASTNAPILIEPGVSVGKVRKGMTTQQVVGELGNPEFSNEYYLVYRQLGFVVTLKGGVVYGVIGGDRYGPHKSMPMPFAGRTREGIGLGSSRTDVVKAYSEGNSVSTDPKLGREELYYEQLRLMFHLQDGKVKCIEVGL
jgi:hypothetical protein